MHERLVRVVIIEALIYFPVCHRDGMSQITAGQRFPQDEDVRLHLVRHEAVTGPAEAGGDLIEDKQHAVLVAQFPCLFQKGQIIHAHAAGSLQEGLHNHAVQILVAEFKCFFQSGDLCGDMEHMGTGSVSFQDKMIVFVVAHFHGPEGISVVGVGQGEHPGTVFLSAVDIILQRHFQGDFHRHAAGVGEKAVVQVSGKPLFQPVRELLHRLMGQAAQHHMGKMLCLRLDGSGQDRMAVAVDHAPPGGDRINHPVVFGIEPDALSVHDSVGIFHGFHLLIGIPDHLASPLLINDSYVNSPAGA